MGRAILPFKLKSFNPGGLCQDPSDKMFGQSNNLPFPPSAVSRCLIASKQADVSELPYRTKTFGIAEPKTVYGLFDQGNKFVQPSKQLEEIEVPFRTNSLVVAEPKSIFANGDQGNKYVQPSKQLDDQEVPFRTSTLVVAEPKSIYQNGDQGNKYVQA